MSVEPFKRLVELVARAFYDAIPKEGEPMMGISDKSGIAVVVLDALTRQQWVREEDLAKQLKLNPKKLRQTLRFLEKEKLITRDERREEVYRTKKDGQSRNEGDEKIKWQTHTYFCLDYAQIYDVVRYRIHHMRKNQKGEPKNKNTVLEYMCPNCTRRYNALDALQLSSQQDVYFHCENCNGELVAEGDMFTALGADGVLQKMEVQLKPLMEQLNRVKDSSVPEFRSLQAWKAAIAAQYAANGDSSSYDPSKSSQGLGYSGMPMPFLGDIKVEVTLSSAEGREVDVKSETTSSSLKVFPPWIIKQGMNLTEKQRGEVKQEFEIDGSSAAGGFLDDKKPTVEDENRSLQEEYTKAYYAAWLKKQELGEAAKKQLELSNEPISDDLSGISFNRQVGMKSKFEEDEEDDDIVWEEAPIADSHKPN